MVNIYFFFDQLTGNYILNRFCVERKIEYAKVIRTKIYFSNL
jgi:hypothetical protein